MKNCEIISKYKHIVKAAIQEYIETVDNSNSSKDEFYGTKRELYGVGLNGFIKHICGGGELSQEEAFKKELKELMMKHKMKSLPDMNESVIA